MNSMSIKRNISENSSTMNLNLDLEKNILQNSKVPKWLQATGKDLSQRQELEIDTLEAAAKEGEYRMSAMDTVRKRPSYRQRTYKKVKRQLAEAEEFFEWIGKKGQKEEETGEQKIDNFLDGLENVLNSMT